MADLKKLSWEGVSAYTNLLMVIFTIALLYSLRQGAQTIQETSRARNAEILNWAMSEMTKIKPEIRLVTEAHKKKPYPRVHQLENTPDWSEQELKAANEVSITLQRLGYYAMEGLIDKKHFLNLWGPSYLGCWYALEGWVRKKRVDLDEPQKLDEGAFSRIHFERFALYCQEMLDPKLVENEKKRMNFQEG